MKKILIGFLLLSLVVLGFVSCNSNAVTLEDGVGAVAFSGMQSAALKSLSATVDHLDKTDLYWRYTAVKKDNGGTQGQTGTAHNISESKPVVGTDSDWGKGLSETHTFSVGTWEFTLYAFSSNTIETKAITKPAGGGYSYEDNYIYKGTATAVVVASTTTKVTVGVSAVSSGDGTGSILISGSISLPTSGYTSAVKKFKISDTATSYASWTTFTTTDVTCANIELGSHTVYVGAFDTSSATEPLVTSSIAVTVYRGLTTNVGGSIDDQTGAVEFDVTMPVTAAAEKQQAATTANKLPAVTVVPQTSPDKIINPTLDENTTVAIPAVTAPSDVTVNVGSNVATEVVVTAYSVKAAPQHFSVSSGETAVAGIDCTYAVSVNGGDAQTIKDFGTNNYATVTTYIEKGLNTVTVTYVGGEFTNRDPIAGYGSGGSTATNVADIYADEDEWTEKEAVVGYVQETGKLVFKTDHFSTFCVATDAKVKIVETGYAYDSLEKAIDAATSGQTVQLLQNVVQTNSIVVDKNITLDLNGKNITVDSNWAGVSPTKSAVFFVKSGATFTVNDSVGTGSIDSTGVDGVNQAVMVTIKDNNDETKTAELIVNGGTLKGYYYGVCTNGSRSNTKITINGGTLMGSVGNASDGTGMYHPDKGPLTINGGTLTGYDGLVIKGGVVNITGGNFVATGDRKDPTTPLQSGGNSTGSALYIEDNYTKYYPTVTVTGGDFTTKEPVSGKEKAPSVRILSDSTPEATLVLKGGTYDTDPSEYVASAYEAKANTPEAGKWTVVKRTAEGSVAKIGNNYYATLEAAVTAAEAEDEITLLANIELTTDLTISKALTIEKGTYTITGEDYIKAGSGYAKTTSGTKIIIAVTPPLILL